jgi:hypothetical protein
MAQQIAILWITILSGPMDGASYGIVFYSQEACLAAKSAVSDTLDYDHNMECV